MGGASFVHPSPKRLRAGNTFLEHVLTAFSKNLEEGEFISNHDNTYSIDFVTEIGSPQWVDPLAMDGVSHTFRLYFILVCEYFCW